MAKIKIPIEFGDPAYFHNKSWTISFNFNTKSWVSFHSYLPNFYIAENNFFYSGLNDCCGTFDFIAAEIPSLLDCTLYGYAIMPGCDFDCDLDGDVEEICTTTTTSTYDPNLTTTTTSTQDPSITTTSTTTIGICDLEGDAEEVCTTTTTTLDPNITTTTTTQEPTTTTTTTLDPSITTTTTTIDPSITTTTTTIGLCELDGEAEEICTTTTTTLDPNITTTTTTTGEVVCDVDIIVVDPVCIDVELIGYTCDGVTTTTSTTSTPTTTTTSTTAEFTTSTSTTIEEITTTTSTTLEVTTTTTSSSTTILLTTTTTTTTVESTTTSTTIEDITTTSTTTVEPTTSTTTVEPTTSTTTTIQESTTTTTTEIPVTTSTTTTSTTVEDITTTTTIEVTTTTTTIEPTTTTTTTTEDITTTTTTTGEDITTTTTIEPTTTSTTSTTIEDVTTTSTSTTLEPTTTTTIEPTTTSTTTLFNGSVVYGLLYNVYAAENINKITSSDDWSIPTIYQMQDLADYLGAFPSYTTNSVGRFLKEEGTDRWNTASSGNNDLGLTLVGIGTRKDIDGTFSSFREKCYLITTTQWTSDYRYYGMVEDSTGLFMCASSTYTIHVNSGNTIRLVKDATGISDGTIIYYTGNNGYVYEAIVINELYWITENLIETEYRDGEPILYVKDSSTWMNMTDGAMCAPDNNWNYVGGELIEPEEHIVTTTTTQEPTTTTTTTI